MVRKHEWIPNQKTEQQQTTRVSQLIKNKSKKICALNTDTEFLKVVFFASLTSIKITQQSKHYLSGEYQSLSFSAGNTEQEISGASIMTEGVPPTVFSDWAGKGNKVSFWDAKLFLSLRRVKNKLQDYCASPRIISFLYLFQRVSQSFQVL